MATRISINVSLTLLAYVCSMKAISSGDSMCPEGCHCYFLGINWHTDCSESNMTAVPQDRLDPNVYTLIMNTNHLEKIEFPPNIKVRNLHVSHNYLTTIQKEMFAGLQYLLDIDLSSNLINYVHPKAFIENAGLITLQLQNNPLKPVEGPFIYTKTLRHLYLENCQLTTISLLFFTEINGLIKVDLSGNPLRIIEAGIFDPLTTLKHLILNNLNLTQIASGLQHHNALDLPNDNLKSSFHWTLIYNYLIGKLSSLEYLELKQSGVSYLPENVLFNFTYLTHLVLAENQLSDINLDTTLGQNLVNIVYLDLSYCNLKAPLSIYALTKATKLTTLILSGNHISTSGLGQAFSSLSKLEKLSLSNCGINKLQLNTFQYIPNLKELDISRNPLNKFFAGSLSIINRLDSLVHLNMSYTNMEIVNRLTISKMTKLKSLILSGNKIKSCVSGFLNNLPRLVLLELNNCGLSDLSSTVFYGTSEHLFLEELRLSGNPLHGSNNGRLIYAYLPKLKSLDLSYCNLSEINGQPLGNLTRLMLNNNKLNGILNVFYILRSRLQHLDLSFNHFTSLFFNVTSDGDRMDYNYNINTLNLIGNPWICECTISSVWAWANQSLVGSKNSIASNKDTNSLVCNFDPNITPAEGLEQNKPCSEFTFTEQYTWVRYMREFKSLCFCLINHVPKRLCEYGWELPEIFFQ